MDLNDIKKLKERGFEITKYPNMLFQNMSSRLNTSKPIYISISYKKRDEN